MAHISRLTAWHGGMLHLKSIAAWGRTAMQKVALLSCHRVETSSISGGEGSRGSGTGVMGNGGLVLIKSLVAEFGSS